MTNEENDKYANGEWQMMNKVKFKLSTRSASGHKTSWSLMPSVVRFPIFSVEPIIPQIHQSPFPIPDSRFSIPDSRFLIPYE
ncbi:MAG: hypothetical protein J7M17_05645 [Anaerolineae bacterium]|nr:hypothetical protein [Anaerolineae bacterium]